MPARLRAYRHSDDFQRVGSFLVETYRPDKQPSNWLLPRWEYMHFFCVPMFELSPGDLARIGVWEDDGRIVGVAHFEDHLGEVYFETHPDYAQLKEEMLEFAEANLSEAPQAGTADLRVFIPDFDEPFRSIAQQRGYVEDRSAAQFMSRLDARGVPDVEPLPRDCELTSLADGDYLAKISRVLHRGFGHRGEPSESNTELLQALQHAPSFRKDLMVAVESPSEDFLAFCGMWYEPVKKFAMIEPLATDPDFRRKGYGKAAVLEAARRVRELGATVVYVASNHPFYGAIGFSRMSSYSAWDKR